MTYVRLDLIDLTIAALLVVGAALISIFLKAKLEKRLFWAALRCVLQLGMVGIILDKVISFSNPVPVLTWLAIMVFFSGKEAVSRTHWKYKGIQFDAWLTMAFSSLIIGTVVTQGIIGVKPWYNARYVIPLLGMIFGNSLNGVSLGLDRFMEFVVTRRAELELFLSFGATRKETLIRPVQMAVRTGMIPIINNMSVVGIVSLPGIMTGQILAGVPPLQAVGYQIVVMFMLAAANGLGSMAAAHLAGRRIISEEGSIHYENIYKNRP